MNLKHKKIIQLLKTGIKEKNLEGAKGQKWYVCKQEQREEYKQISQCKQRKQDKGVMLLNY